MPFCIRLYLLLLFFSWACSPQTNETTTPSPMVLDDDIQLQLIAEDPDIVTPIGLAIDGRDVIYVLESHTHLPPDDYKGPAFDRVKKGIDNDADGIPDQWLTFADSISDGMNLEVSPEGIVYVVTKDQLLAFEPGQESKAQSRSILLSIQLSGQVYDHAGMLGVTTGPDGWLYVSRGNCGSLAYTIMGTDGSSVSGYGDGGSVIRCRPDGSEVQEIATGFWNPFDLQFSSEGRLMLVDNDPDSRGPNRLIEVVPGGDYGYQSLYGGSGIHAFQAWNGELPGTLPYAAALGEAPSGVLDASFSNLPNTYQNNIISTIWEENSIVRVPLQSHNSTVSGVAEVIIQGDSSFHPVALATDSKGNIYMTDWVVRQYPNHGRGKIWRISTNGDKAPIARSTSAKSGSPHNFFAQYGTGADAQLQALQTGDLFKQAVARRSLSEDESNYDRLVQLTRHKDADLRLQALLTLSEFDKPLDKLTLLGLLHDGEEDIRRMAMVYIAKHGRQKLLPEVEQALYEGYINPALFETYLATVRHLQPEFIQALKEKKKPESKKIVRVLPATYLMNIITNEELDTEVRAMAIPYLNPRPEEIEKLSAMLPGAPLRLQAELIYALKQQYDPEIADAMRQIVLDRDKPDDLRAEALVILSYQPTKYCSEVAGIFSEDSELLLEAAVRYLCACKEEVPKVDQLIADSKHNDTGELMQMWQVCRGEQLPKDYPSSDEEWTASVDQSGDPTRGKVIFQLTNTQCTVCHQVDGWGGNFGPDLTNVGSSKSEGQLLESILEPSAAISPEWQGWYLVDEDGQKHYGRQIDVGGQSAKMLMPTGEFVNYPNPQGYGVASNSLMPDGLENTLTPTEFNHLIAYLKSLK